MIDPLKELATWREEGRGSVPEPDAMILATASASGAPDARVVLCRSLDARGLCFYTNYESRKGGELAANPRACAVFYWPSAGRQARVEGSVEKLSPAESDQYFASRPRGHQLNAWASAQSRVIASLDDVAALCSEFEAKYVGRDVPRPPHWGGYRLVPQAVELWQSGENRLHLRRRFVREAAGWREELLSP